MNAFVFTGQGCQKEGMGLDLYNKHTIARQWFDRADDILGYKFSDIMFYADENELLDTRNTQLAILIYEVALYMSQSETKADCMAGHSLGEYAALICSGCLDFEDGIELIKQRGEILFEAQTKNHGAMGVVIGLTDETVEKTVKEYSVLNGDSVYIANYNGPGQLVVAGGRSAIKTLCRQFKELGAKRAMLLPISAMVHCPLAQYEADLFRTFIEKMTFSKPDCPIFQCVDGKSHTDIDEIKQNLIRHLTYPVQWTTIVNNMVAAGVSDFYEIGTDDTLQKIISRMYPNLGVHSIWDIDTYKNINPYKIEEL